MLGKKSILTGIGVTLFTCQLVGCSSQVPTSEPVVVEPTAVSTSTREVMATTTTEPAPELELVWETKGKPNPFRIPVGVTVDKEGNVYIMDTENFRVQKFDSDGNFILMWGSKGSGDGQFLNASSWGTLGHLAADTEANIYVLDSVNYRIQKFDSSGNYSTHWGTEGTGEGEFRLPYDIAIDAQSNAYVCESQYNNTVQKFDTNGKFLLRWGKTGYKDGEFAGDMCTVAIDPDGNVLVADRTGRIQKFDASGRFLSKILLEPLDNRLVSPWNMDVDRQGNIYIGDYDNLRIVKLDSEGRVLVSWSGTNEDEVSFSSLLDIAVDDEGNIYISDAVNHSIKKFRQR